MYGENRVLGEYIVTIRESGDEALIRKIFDANFGIKIEDLGRGRCRINLK